MTYVNPIKYKRILNRDYLVNDRYWLRFQPADAQRMDIWGQSKN